MDRTAGRHRGVGVFVDDWGCMHTCSPAPLRPPPTRLLFGRVIQPRGYAEEEKVCLFVSFIAAFLRVRCMYSIRMRDVDILILSSRTIKRFNRMCAFCHIGIAA